MLIAILCLSLMMIIDWYMQLLCNLVYKRRLAWIIHECKKEG